MEILQSFHEWVFSIHFDLLELHNIIDTSIIIMEKYYIG